MKIRHLRSSNYVSMPWKNGNGSTLQMGIFPDHAVFPKDEFLWRMSSAPVMENGEFSLFEGYDRWIVIWQGKGLRLYNDDAGTATVLKVGEPHLFSGDAHIRAELLEGPVRDFGFIFRRDQATATLEVLRPGGKPHQDLVQTGVLIWVCASGSARITVDGGSFRLSSKEAFSMQASEGEETVAAPVQLEALEPHTVIFSVRLTPVT